MSLSSFNLIILSHIKITTFVEAIFMISYIEVTFLTQGVLPIVINKVMKNDVSVTENIIPFLQIRLDKDEMKKRLDEYSMVRKKTHFTIPDSNIQMTKQKSNELLRIFNRMNITPNSNNTDKSFPYSNKTYLRLDNITKLRQNKGSTEFTSAQNEMFKVLTRQAELLIEIIERIESRSFLRSTGDFEDLLEELDTKKEAPIVMLNSEETTKDTQNMTAQTERPSTVMTVFDETEIRETLINDPYVKRIMKMANKNREDYIKAAKKYYNLQK